MMVIRSRKKYIMISKITFSVENLNLHEFVTYVNILIIALA